MTDLIAAQIVADLRDQEQGFYTREEAATLIEQQAEQIAATRTALSTIMAERSTFERDLDAAEATLATIKNYAENLIGSWRIAAELLAILNRKDT